MAKIYGNIGASALMTFDKSFSRSNGQPLDSTEVFYSKAAALSYAATDVAYVGQKIVVITTEDDVTKVTHYGIEPDNTLKELGSSPVGDENTIVVAEDGTVSLAGISGLEFTETNAEGEAVSVTYQPLLTGSGLTWVRPSATTVEGLATEIEGLKTRLTAVEGEIDALQAIDHEAYKAADEAVLTEAKEYAAEEAGKAMQAANDAQTDADAIGAIVETLVGTDIGKSVRTIANEELAAQLIAEDAAESLDTLAEIAAWIQSHPEDASAMNAAIAALQKQLVGIANEEGAVKKYVDDAITALSIGDYAKASALTALADRVAAIEAKVSTWDAAEQNAKDYADGLNAAMNTRVEAVEGASHEHSNKTVLDGVTAEKVTAWDDAASKAHEHTNKTVLDGITAEKVTAWDAAEQNAKDYAAGLNSTMNGRVATLEGLMDTGNQTISSYVSSAISENVTTVSNSEIDNILAI